MRQLTLLISLLLFLHKVNGQNIKISGRVLDSLTSEPLIGVSVYVMNVNKGTATDLNGKFSLLVPIPCKIRFSYTGYKNKEISLTNEIVKNIEVVLTEQNMNFQELVVSARNEVDGLKYQTGITSLSMKQISSVPVLGGERDIMKVLQLMPGVQQANQGNTALLVRGGSPDQNLILLDDAPIYNPSHVLGFFSIFNEDIIKDVTMQKGGFTPNFGGKLSSVTDIKTKDGNFREWNSQLGLGILAVRATVEGPISKDKLSFLASFRRSHVDQLFKIANNNMPAYFYDANLKLSWTPTKQDKLSLTLYHGKDILRLSSQFDESLKSLDFRTDVGNQAASLKWNHTYKNKRFFHTVSLVKTQFNFDVLNKFDTSFFLIRSSITDYVGKVNYTFQINPKHQIKAGTEHVLHLFKPNMSIVRGLFNENIVSNRQNVIEWNENAFYIAHHARLGTKTNLHYGMRFTSASVQNKIYFNPEPRIQVSYDLTNNQTIKLAYSKMNQYAHLVSSNSGSLPTDMWYPVTRNILPQNAQQYTIGYSYQVPKYNVEFTVEAYAKSMKNLIEFKDGTLGILNNNIEADLVQGRGESMGIEWMIHKKQGKFNGWLSYTLSKSVRQFDELNNGEYFHARYDRRHNFSWVVNYEINSRITFSALFTMASGSRFTPIVGKYVIPNPGYTDVEILPIYGKRNSQILSPTHRIDFNIVIKNKPTKKFRAEWHIGAYNVYNQIQPYRLELTSNDKGDLVYRELGLFGFLPSIAYNINF